MIREIVLDTETTGLDPRTGDRVVEIGCVELINHVPTGKSFHAYVNPERDMPEDAYRVHGLSTEFLADKPLFSACVDEFLAFIGQDTLVIHNAPFDMGFLNAEFATIRRAKLENPVIDTVQLARKVHPGARVNLDALCKHYGIDNSRRAKHGALLDSEILAEVYLELIGGRQVALTLGAEALEREAAAIDPALGQTEVRQRPAPLPPRVTPDERTGHAELLADMGEGALWRRYSGDETA